MTVTTPITGHCLCGAVSYSVDTEPMSVILCHCEDCRRHSGAPTTLNVVFDRTAVAIDETHVKIFETVGSDTGEKRERWFCDTCGTPIVTILAEMPEITVIKGGTLDDPSWVEPEMELYTESAHPWVHNPDALERGLFPRSIPT